MNVRDMYSYHVSTSCEQELGILGVERMGQEAEENSCDFLQAAVRLLSHIGIILFLLRSLVFKTLMT